MKKEFSKNTQYYCSPAAFVFQCDLPEKLIEPIIGLTLSLPIFILCARSLRIYFITGENYYYSITKYYILCISTYITYLIYIFEPREAKSSCLAWQNLRHYTDMATHTVLLQHCATIDNLLKIPGSRLFQYTITIFKYTLFVLIIISAFTPLFINIRGYNDFNFIFSQIRAVMFYFTKVVFFLSLSVTFVLNKQVENFMDRATLFTIKIMLLVFGVCFLLFWAYEYFNDGVLNFVKYAAIFNFRASMVIKPVCVIFIQYIPWFIMALLMHILSSYEPSNENKKKPEGDVLNENLGDPIDDFNSIREAGYI